MSMHLTEGHYNESISVAVIDKTSVGKYSGKNGTFQGDLHLGKFENHCSELTWSEHLASQNSPEWIILHSRGSLTWR